MDGSTLSGIVAEVSAQRTATNAVSIFHLTPLGWREGDLPPPAALETWILMTPEGRWECVWANPAHTRSQREAARARHAVPAEVAAQGEVRLGFAL